MHWKTSDLWLDLLCLDSFRSDDTYKRTIFQYGDNSRSRREVTNGRINTNESGRVMATMCHRRFLLTATPSRQEHINQRVRDNLRISNVKNEYKMIVWLVGPYPFLHPVTTDQDNAWLRTHRNTPNGVSNIDVIGFVPKKNFDICYPFVKMC